MDTTHLVDHTYLVSLVVIAIVSVISALFHRYSHRVLKEDSPKSQFARWGTQFMMLVLVALWLNNFYGDAHGRFVKTISSGFTQFCRRKQADYRRFHAGPWPEVG